MTRDQFLTDAAPRVEPVELSSGNAYHVRSLEWSDYQHIRKLKLDAKHDVDEAHLQVLLALCDEQGKRLLEDDDLPVVERMPASDFTRLLRKVNDISGQHKKLSREIDEAGEG